MVRLTKDGNYTVEITVFCKLYWTLGTAYYSLTFDMEMMSKNVVNTINKSIGYFERWNLYEFLGKYRQIHWTVSEQNH